MRKVIIVAIGVITGISVACVTNELDSVDRARAAYQACEIEKSASDPECQALRQEHVDAQSRYEESARRVWGCGLNEADCPTER